MTRILGIALLLLTFACSGAVTPGDGGTDDGGTPVFSPPGPPCSAPALACDAGTNCQCFGAACDTYCTHVGAVDEGQLCDISASFCKLGMMCVVKEGDTTKSYCWKTCATAGSTSSCAGGKTCTAIGGCTGFGVCQ